MYFASSLGCDGGAGWAGSGFTGEKGNTDALFQRTGTRASLVSKTKAEKMGEEQCALRLYPTGRRRSWRKV